MKKYILIIITFAYVSIFSLYPVKEFTVNDNVLIEGNLYIDSMSQFNNTVNFNNGFTTTSGNTTIKNIININNTIGNDFNFYIGNHDQTTNLIISNLPALGNGNNYLVIDPATNIVYIGVTVIPIPDPFLTNELFCNEIINNFNEIISINSSSNNANQTATTINANNININTNQINFDGPLTKSTGDIKIVSPIYFKNSLTVSAINTANILFDNIIDQSTVINLNSLDSTTLSIDTLLTKENFFLSGENLAILFSNGTINIGTQSQNNTIIFSAPLIINNLNTTNNPNYFLIVDNNSNTVYLMPENITQDSTTNTNINVTNINTIRNNTIITTESIVFNSDSVYLNGIIDSTNENITLMSPVNFNNDIIFGIPPTYKSFSNNYSKKNNQKIIKKAKKIKKSFNHMQKQKKKLQNMIKKVAKKIKNTNKALSATIRTKGTYEIL